MYQIEYLRQFWEAYPDNHKFFRTHFSEAHELSGELIRYIDIDIRNLLDEFYTKGYLNNTMLMIISDHGSHSVTIRVPVLPDNSRYIENYLPLLFHLSPKNIPEQNLKFLSSNQQSLISSHDIYATLTWITENKEPLNYTYIKQTIPVERNCTTSDIWIGDCWCQHDREALNQQIGERPLFSFAF